MTKRRKPGKRIIVCPRCSRRVDITGHLHLRIAAHNCIGAEMTELQYRIWRQLPVRMEFAP